MFLIYLHPFFFAEYKFAYRINAMQNLALGKNFYPCNKGKRNIFLKI